MYKLQLEVQTKKCMLKYMIILAFSVVTNSESSFYNFIYLLIIIVFL